MVLTAITQSKITKNIVDLSKKYKKKLVKLLWTMRDKVKEKVKARFKIKVKVKVIKVNIYLKW